MLTLLASGTLVSDPRERTGQSGKPYAVGSMRVPCEGGEPVLVSLIAFSRTAMDGLLALTKGDGLAVTGRAKPSTWTKDGTEHHGLSIVAEQVMSAYQLEKRRKRATGENGDDGGSVRHTAEGFDS